VDGKVYELAEIYGFMDGLNDGDRATATTSPSIMGGGEHVVNMGDDEANDDALCVICMTDVADTSLIPCRHMCLCYDCSHTLRTQTNKCPICRSKILSMIQIPQASSSINDE